VEQRATAAPRGAVRAGGRPHRHDRRRLGHRARRITIPQPTADVALVALSALERALREAPRVPHWRPRCARA